LDRIKPEQIYHRMINAFHRNYVNNQLKEAWAIYGFLIDEIKYNKLKGIRYITIENRLEKEITSKYYDLPAFLRLL